MLTKLFCNGNDETVATKILTIGRKKYCPDFENKCQFIWGENLESYAEAFVARPVDIPLGSLLDI